MIYINTYYKSMVKSNCRDNLRGFFEQCFSLLLKQTFGYDGSSWLNSIAKVSSAARPCTVFHFNYLLLVKQALMC